MSNIHFELFKFMNEHGEKTQDVRESVMPDREKVIKGLECCQYSSKSHCDGCPYVYEGLCSTNDCTADLAIEAIAVLKEQEAATIKKTKEHGFGVYGGICPKCRNWIQSAHSFCGFCGQAVKWDE